MLLDLFRRKKRIFVCKLSIDDSRTVRKYLERSKYSKKIKVDVYHGDELPFIFDSSGFKYDIGIIDPESGYGSGSPTMRLLYINDREIKLLVHSTADILAGKADADLESLICVE